MNRRQSDQRRMRAADQQELRTPLAWQRRDSNYQQQHHHVYAERFGMVPEVGQMPSHFHYPIEQGGHESNGYGEDIGMSRGPSRSRPRSSNYRPRSPSTDTSSSTSTGDQDNDSQLKYGGALTLQDPRHGGGPPHAMGTLRSVQSTVTTWDGEPCPVHHMPMPMPIPMPMPMQLQPPLPQHYPMLALAPPPPPVLLPPMLRPRPLVLPADAPAPPEPLPVRDPVSPLPPKDGTHFSKNKPFQCCKGHIIVLWIILCIILTGILLGVVLRFVFA